MTARRATGRAGGHVPRRDALRLAAAAGMGALLAACGGGTPTTAPTASSATTAPTGGGGAATTTSEVGAITVPNTGLKVPTQNITFRWIDSGDLKALFYNKYFPAYHKAHSNITVQYDALPWTEINKIVPLGVQNGDAHDCFAVPQNFTGAQAVAQGWVAPLDDIVPNFSQWKSGFPFGSFIEGIHVFDGKTYTFPVTSNKRYGTLTLYSVDYMQRAGYDPAAKLLTWDEFRAAAKKMTAQGKGQYYGLVVAGKGNYLDGFVGNLARMAGASAGTGANAGTDHISYKTGEYTFATDQYLAAIDLLLALKSDGSILPGSLSLNSSDARARMPQGAAGMVLEGPWNIPQWPRENPDFKFEVTSQPVPNSGAALPLSVEETGANQQWVYARSKYKEIAGDMFAYIGSPEGQTAIVVATEGNLRALIPEANEKARQSRNLDPHASRALQLFEQQVRLAPMAVVRNTDVARVFLELKAITPNFNDTLVGLFSGQISDSKKAMQDLKDRADKEMDRAIKAAQAKGAKVTRDDWVFPNWDPTKDYAEADYAALKK